MKLSLSLVLLLVCFSNLFSQEKEADKKEEVKKETSKENVKADAAKGNENDPSQKDNKVEKKEEGTNKTAMTEQEAKALRLLQKTLEKSKIRAAAEKKKAEVHYIQGKNLYEKGLYEQAITSLKKATIIDPSNKKAASLLAAARGNTNKDHNPVATERKILIETTSVKRQEEIAEINNRMEIAKGFQNDSANLIGKGNSDLVGEDLVDQRIKLLRKAMDEYRKILEKLQFADLNDKSIRGFEDTVIKEQKNIKLKIESLEEELTRLKKESAVKYAIDRNDKEKDLSNKRIQSLIESAEKAFKRGNYIQCEKICRQIKRLDPINKKAVKLISKSRKKLKKKNTIWIKKNFDEENKRWKEKNLRDMIPWSDPITYSEDWDWISQRSAVKNVKKRISAWEARYRGILDQQGTFDWSQQTLGEVIDELRENYPGLFIKTDKTAFDTLGITDEELVDLKVTGLPLKHILNLLLSQYGLTYGLVNEALVISDEKGVQGELTLERYDVRDLTVAIGNFPGPDVSLSNSTGIGGDSGGDSGINFDDEEEVEAVTAEDIKNLIISKLHANSWDDARGTSIVESNGQLLVTQTYEMHQQIEEFLTRLRRSRATQVFVNARFINHVDNSFEALGVNWQGLDQATVNDISGTGANTGAGFLSDITNLDSVDGRASVFTGIPTSGQNNGGLLAQVAVLGNTQFEAVLAALQTSNKAETLNVPRLLVYNNQLAYIAIVEQQSFISDFNISDSTFDPQIGTFFEGIVLEVRPTISANRKYITLQVSPTLRELRGFTALPTITSAAFGTNLETRTPIIQTTSVQTTVAIPDRGVMMIGGLTKTTQGTTTGGIPILSKIPLLGRLFRTDTREERKDNILMLINAEIILLEEIEGDL